MHPSMIAWWRSHREAAHGHCHASAGFGHGHGGGGPWSFGSHGDGGGFGVRRPLRFLIHKLELDEKQAAQLAKILDELKTERAQAAVDDRRSTAAFADAVQGEAFDQESAKVAAKRRAETAERVALAVEKALGEIHALLDAEQRETLAYLIRTGALGI
jgi:Spy/CpxP family protein refolding chaperone